MVNPSNPVRTRALMAASVLAGLPEEGLDRLCAVASTARYETDTLLWPAGQPMSSLWLIVEGRIDIYDRQTEGSEGLVGVIGPGRWVSWVGLFMERPHMQDFWAAAATCLIAVPAEVMRQVLARHPALYPRVIDDVGNRLQILMQMVGQVVVGTPAQRLAGLLHGLAHVQAIESRTPRLETSQAKLALMLGMSRQLVGKSLEMLEQQGLVRRAYGAIELLDLRGLEDFSRKPE